MDEPYLLELSILPRADQQYTIDARLFGPDKRPWERPYAASGSAIMTLDLPGLLTRALDPLAYGTYLQQIFFADQRVREALQTARAAAAERNAPLRLRLRLDPNHAELHRVRWELLRDPAGAGFLTTHERTLFSRYFDPQRAPRVERRPTARPQALVAVASPTDLANYGLVQLEVESELVRAAQALQEADLIRLAYPSTSARATFARIVEYLRAQLDIVYLICHGRTLDDDQDSVLYLEGEDGRCELVSGRALVEALAGVARWPKLLILASCQTAGTDVGDSPQAAIGPKLIEAGCPALLVINGNMSVQAAERFFPIFFHQLHIHGDLELALATARAACHNLSDWWRPVLYTRLEDGRIWQPAAPPRLHAGVPELPPYYITRETEEAQVVQMIAQDQEPVCNIYGLPGTGKTALIAAVLRRRYPQIGVDGVLWGDLGRLTPAEQLWEFLSTLTSPAEIPPDRVDLLRILFWRQVREKRLRLAIVLDNVASSQAATALLPPGGELPSGCRVVLISLEELRLLPHGRLPCLPISTFDADLTRRLFVAVLGQPVVDRYGDELAMMGLALGGLPQLVTMAALQLRSADPRSDKLGDEIATYARQADTGDHAYHDRLDLALRHLTAPQIAVLELIGVIGEGDWTAALIAAACLRPLTDATTDLEALVNRGVIMRLPSGRYNTNRLIRNYARAHLFQKPDEQRQTSLYLLARACLDIAEDCYRRALEQVGVETPHVPDTARVAVVQQVRHQLLPEIAHIRQAILWAEQNPAWRLVERFGRLAWFELLDGMATNTREVTGSLLLATLYQPVFWHAGHLVQVHGRSGITSQPLRFAHPGLHDVFEISDAYAFTRSFQWPKLSRDTPHPHADDPSPELNLHLTASRVVDGIISGYSMIEARWVGVEAERLMLCEVDLGGARLLNCNLRRSLLQDCNAPHAELRTVDLQQAILERVRLRGAHLTNVDLRGARLTNVDLRGAQLADVDLRGAVLERVNLRNSTLTMVRLDGATLDGVAIHRAEVHRCTWYGCAGIPDSDNAQLVAGIATQARERQAEPDGPKPLARSPAVDILAAPADDFHKQDLRGVNLAGKTFLLAPPERPSFVEVALDRASMQDSALPRAALYRASLRAANLLRARAPGADLREANLQAVLAENVNLHLANLQGASLRSARLRGSILTGANLTHADLSGADLREADLREADLRGAVLIGADLRGARVDDIALARAGSLSRSMVTILGRERLVRELGGAFREMEPLFDPGTLLYFALCSGTFVQVGLAECGLFGAQLTGTFEKVSLRQSDLRWAKLSGSFVNVCFCEAGLEHSTLSGVFTQCGFEGARLAGARLAGTWSRANFRNADLHDADWTDASLVEVDLRGARGVTLERLLVASRLRGTILPEGQRFVSSQGLPGDRDDARQYGYDPDDPAAMTSFYENAGQIHS